MPPDRLPLKEYLREARRAYIMDVLKQEGGNRLKAARVLGVSGRVLFYFAREYQLPKQPMGHPKKGET